MRVALAAGQEIAALVRASAADSVVVVIAGERDALALAVAVAAVGPLAVERAPGRVNAVLAAAGADPATVAGAVAFLEGARSTTGQVIEVGQPAGG